MIQTLGRRLRVYGAMAAMMPKFFLAYRIWVWMEFVVQVIALIIFVAFWRAVYVSQETLGGLNLTQTLNYIILAQIFLPAVHNTNTIHYLGDLMHDGQVGIELLRPLDLQAATYTRSLAQMVVGLLVQLPLAIVAWLIYQYQLPADPRVWVAFVVTLFLGHALLFAFDWILACVAFYSTEIWGLSVLRFSIGVFFSGSLVPLAMMPDWLQKLTAALPFAQALYMPVSFLSGITPLGDAPRIWLNQLIYLVILLPVSRLIFRVAARKVTVQGG